MTDAADTTELAALGRTIRDSLSPRRLIVALGVAGTMGAIEWVSLGHPIGLAFGVVMGLAALVVAPLPWLLLLPWGLRRGLLATAGRALAVLAIAAVVVVAAFAAYFALVAALVPARAPLLPHAVPLLAGWASVVICIPLFAAAGWGLARHLELERRLEVHDVREVALQAALDDARHHALRARLDPHFLFNALNLVTELCRDDPAEAERCVLRLSALLRAALEAGERPLVPLGRELDLCADYLELCRARFGDRLRVTLERDPAADTALVPSLAVQVLCENAVRHGIEARAGGGTVRLATAARGEVATVEVTSPGPCGAPRPGAVGLTLTRRRLALAFGDRAALAVATAPSGDATVAVLTLPRGAPDAAAGDGPAAPGGGA
jgi:hypothetical protein